MDPGNWSTDIAGGSSYGYDLLFIVLMSSLIAIFLQALAIKQGLATERDLAQACRDSYPTWVVLILWIVSLCHFSSLVNLLLCSYVH
jgi:manganese transport protein